MSRQDPGKQQEQHPGLSGLEFIGFKIFFWLLSALGKLLKVLVMLIFPSLWLYRKDGGLWTRLTAGFWPISYAGYLLAVTFMIRGLWPGFADLVEMSWTGIHIWAVGIFLIVSVLTIGHRLAYFRVPGASLIRAAAPSDTSHTEDGRSKFRSDEVYKKHDGSSKVPNVRSDWHGGFAGGSGLGKTTAMLIYLNQLNMGDEDYAIICYDEDGEFAEFLQQMGYETYIFNPRNPDVIPRLMSCIEHPDDLDVIADALVSGTSQDNNKFAPGAKTVITGGLRLLWDRLGQDVTNNMIYRFFSRDPEEIYEELENGGYEQYGGPIRDSESGQSPHMTVINTAMNKGLRGKLKEEGTFNLSTWVQNPGRQAIILETGADDMDAAGPALRLIIDLAMREGFRNSSANAFLLADEVDTLPGSSMIGEVAARGRSKGCFVVIGFQTVAQLEDNFGEGPAEKILSNLGNYFIFNPRTDQSTWDMIKKLLGEERRREYTSSQSKSSQRAFERNRHTAGTSEQIQERCPVSDSEISRMAPGDCIIVDFDGDWWFCNLTLPEWAR